MLDNLIRFSYPYPISATYQNIESITYPEEMPQKYRRMIDLYDSILKILVYYLAGFAYSNGMISEKTHGRVETTLKNPTPNNWSGLLAELLNTIDQNRDPLIAYINEFYRKEDASLPAITNSIEYMNLRSSLQEEGPGRKITIKSFFECFNRFLLEISPSDNECEEIVNMILPAFREVLVCLNFLKYYPLCYVSGIQVEGDDYAHNVDFLSGLAPTRKRYLSDSPIPEKNRKLYVFEETEDGLSPKFCLHPFVVIHRCGMHDKNEIYFLRYRFGNEMDYYCFQCRERFHPERLHNDFSEIFDINAKKQKNVSDEIIEAFQNQVALAWKDGAITDEDRLKIVFLRKHLGISEKLAKNIEDRVKNDLGVEDILLELNTIRKFEELIKNSIIKNKISPSMRAVINIYRDSLKIPENYAKKIEARIWYDAALAYQEAGYKGAALTCFDMVKEINLTIKESSGREAIFSGMENAPTPSGPLKKPLKENISEEKIAPLAATEKAPEKPAALDSAKIQAKEPIIKITDAIYPSAGGAKILKSPKSRDEDVSPSKAPMFKANQMGEEEQEDSLKSPLEIKYEMEEYEDLSSRLGEDEKKKSVKSWDKILIPEKSEDTEEIQVIETRPLPESEFTKSDDDMTATVSYKPETNESSTESLSKTKSERSKTLVESISGQNRKIPSAEVYKSDIPSGDLLDIDNSKTDELTIENNPKLVKEITNQLAKAKKYLQIGRYDKSMEILSWILRVDSGNIVAMLLRSKCAMEEEYFEQAYQDLEEVLKVKKDDATLLMMHGKAALEIGKRDVALLDFEKILKKQPENPSAYFQRGLVYLDMGQFEKAITDFDFVIKVNPSEPDAYINRGTCWLEIKEYDYALDDYRKAYEINPRDAFPLFKQGLTYYRLGDYGKALESYDKAIDLDYSENEYYIERSNALAALRRYDEALENLNHVLSVSPDSWLALSSRAKIYESMGKNDDAIEDLTALSEISGCEPEGLAQRGRLYGEIGQTDMAMADFEKSLNIDPQNLNACLFKANELVKIGNFDEAIDIYSQILQINNRFVEARLHRGIVYEKIGEEEKAKEDFEKYLQSNRLLRELI